MELAGGGGAGRQHVVEQPEETVAGGAFRRREAPQARIAREQKRVVSDSESQGEGVREGEGGDGLAVTEGLRYACGVELEDNEPEW